MFGCSVFVRARSKANMFSLPCMDVYENCTWSRNIRSSARSFGLVSLERCWRSRVLMHVSDIPTYSGSLEPGGPSGSHIAYIPVMFWGILRTCSRLYGCVLYRS